ncbi:hypothetical protein AAHA92_01245 [Salvia divinorum]|uniref:Uncharacterized protein n=1 Tax=Salvia divinorum TaxID=28513 RepID=A0ABD1IPM5_SALDI
MPLLRCSWLIVVESFIMGKFLRPSMIQIQEIANGKSTNMGSERSCGRCKKSGKEGTLSSWRDLGRAILGSLE